MVRKCSKKKNFNGSHTVAILYTTKANFAYIPLPYSWLLLNNYVIWTDVTATLSIHSDWDTSFWRQLVAGVSIYLIPRLYQGVERGVNCVNGSRRIMNGIALKYDLHDAYIPGVGSIPSHSIPSELPQNVIRLLFSHPFPCLSVCSTFTYLSHQYIAHTGCSRTGRGA
jgi:hypothetical protein